MMKGVSAIFNYTIGIALLLGFWQYLSSAYPPAIIPSLGSVGNAMIEVLRDENLLSEAMYSFYRVLVASFISVFGGIALGIIGGSRPFFYKALYPVFIVFENVPPIAWLVIAIMWFSIGSMPSIAVGIFTSIPIIFFYTVEGIRNTKPKLLEMADDFLFPRWKKLLYIYIPSIMPSISASLSTAISLNWRVVVMAEALTAYNGIGQKLWGSYLYGDSVVTFVYVFVIAFLGLCMEYLAVKPLRHVIDRRFVAQ
jgi:ABC-type nitrate/sulfonate/bicarbonate transport system permease component